MVRIGAEDRRQVQTVIDGTLYSARRGYFEMPDHHARAHMRSGNLPTPAIGGPAPSGIGYTCTGCGRGTYFKTCGNCGSDCTRES